VKATPDVAETIKNLFKVLNVEKEIEEPSEAEIVKFRARKQAQSLDPNEPMWAG